MREVNKMISGHALTHSRAFIDDLLTGGDTWTKYLENQRLLFLACRDHGWLTTISKLRIGFTDIAALGHLVSHQTVKPDPEKVSAIKRLTPPTTESGVRAFLGLVGYYRRFIDDFARMAKPLTKLLSKEQEFIWGPE